MTRRQIVARTAAVVAAISGIVLSPPDRTAAQAPPDTNPGERVVYPANDQADAQQASDQSACYEWSTTSTEWNPHDAYGALEEEHADAFAQYQSTQGTAVRGAARGALAGLAIGAIAGDAGKGAAIGATAGVLRGGRRGAAQRQAAQERFEEALGDFRSSYQYWDRHWSACMDGRGYAVR